MIQTAFGHFPHQKDWFYQLDIHVRLNTFDPIFRQNLNTLRIGRHLSDTIDYSAAFAYAPTQLQARFINEQRLWEQIDYRYQLSETLSAQFYNRLEIRWVHEAPGISMRDRFKIVVRACSPQAIVCPYLASETFINMNRTAWDLGKTLAQQRSGIGLENKLSKAVTLRFGYLNQTLWFRVNNNLSYDIIDLQATFNFD
jgi:hypothetical protein